MATLRNTLVILRHGLTSLSALKTAAESRVKSGRFRNQIVRSISPSPKDLITLV